MVARVPLVPFSVCRWPNSSLRSTQGDPQTRATACESRPSCPVVVYCLRVGVTLIIIDVGTSVLMRCDGRILLKVDSGSCVGLAVLGMTNSCGWEHKSLFIMYPAAVVTVDLRVMDFGVG